MYIYIGVDTWNYGKHAFLTFFFNLFVYCFILLLSVYNFIVLLLLTF